MNTTLKNETADIYDKFMQRIIAKAIGGIKLSDVQMDEIIKCGAKGGCIMSGMMSL